MTEWIKISYKPPPKHKPVLITDGKVIGICRVKIVDGQSWIQFGYTNLIKSPTHWMCLPKLPGEKND